MGILKRAQRLLRIRNQLARELLGEILSTFVLIVSRAHRAGGGGWAPGVGIRSGHRGAFKELRAFKGLNPRWARGGGHQEWALGMGIRSGHCRAFKGLNPHCAKGGGHQ